MSKGKRVPPLSITDTGSYRGRLQLRGVYPSASGGDDNITSGHDDGTTTGCTCLGYQHTGKCWHLTALAEDYWRARWEDAKGAEREERERWLRHFIASGAGDEGDMDAARLELGALGDLVGDLTRTQEAA